MNSSDKTNNTTMQENSNSDQMVMRISNIVEEHKTAEIYLSSTTTHKMYETIDKSKTHRHGGFWNTLAPGQQDDRESFDIISPMIETILDNIDLDMSHLDTYTARIGYNIQALIMKSQIRIHAKQTNLGIKMDEVERDFVDDGNVILRDDPYSGEFFQKVDPLNIFVTDQSAKTFEETGVVEYSPLDQSTLRRMAKKGGWKNVNKVIENLNIGTFESPLYEIYYYFDEINEQVLNEIKKENGMPAKDDSEIDSNSFIQAQIIVAKGETRGDATADEQKNVNEFDKGNEQQEILPQGEVVFAEERKPETIKVTSKLTIVRYKPYEIGCFSDFSNRLWSEGAREMGMVYQERANEIGTRIVRTIRLARALFYSDSPSVQNMNVMSSLKDGQVIHLERGTQFGVLNDQFPNFNLLIEEWNRNLQEARRSLKAFQVATGEQTPSSATATAISNQAQAVGKYFSKKREKLGMFIATVYARWVIPKMKKEITKDGSVMINDSEIMTDVVDIIASGLISRGNTRMNFRQVKARLLNKEKLFVKIKKEFFKNVDVYVGINPSGQSFNKQNKISNAMVLMQQWVNPNYLQNPITFNMLKEISYELGIHISQQDLMKVQQQMAQQQQMRQQMAAQQQQEEAGPKPEQQQAGRLPEQMRQAQEQKSLQQE